MVRHTLRHTAITLLVQAGVNLPTVKRISGHETHATVERYGQQYGAPYPGRDGKARKRYPVALPATHADAITQELHQRDLGSQRADESRKVTT